MNPALLPPLCVLLASSFALAQPGRNAPNWVRIQTENDGNKSTFVDVKSIRAGRAGASKGIGSVSGRQQDHILATLPAGSSPLTGGTLPDR